MICEREPIVSLSVARATCWSWSSVSTSRKSESSVRTPCCLFYRSFECNASISFIISNGGKGKRAPITTKHWTVYGWFIVLNAEKILWSFAEGKLQSISIQWQLAVLTGDRASIVESSLIVWPPSALNLAATISEFQITSFYICRRY